MCPGKSYLFISVIAQRCHQYMMYELVSQYDFRAAKVAELRAIKIAMSRDTAEAAAKPTSVSRDCGLDGSQLDSSISTAEEV